MYIARCLALAERGRGCVGTNPLVGAVLVRKGRIIAEGWHRGFGQDHAERGLLGSFNQSLEADDVLYVNLEPCCHHGKTPPCTDALIERGVKHVVYGMEDPNPEVAGRGIALLREAGVTIRGPVSPEACLRLNRGFVSLKQQGRPWITLKCARTQGGAVANPDGSPLKITSPAQDAWSHMWLRARHDAIAVGINTVLSDDPQLTVRISNKNLDQTFPQPLRLIFDPHLKIPLTAKVIAGGAGTGTALVTAPNADMKRVKQLSERGVRVFMVPMEAHGFAWEALWKLLTTPQQDFHGIASVLLEGGPSTWEFFRKAGMVDEEVILVGGGERLS